MTHSFADQLECARRELRMRERAYPRWIASGKMTQKKADLEISLQVAIIETLEKLAKGGLLL